MRHLALLVLAASPLACLRATSYTCATDDQCGADGRCELATGFCSFTDASCAQGRRYGNLSGPLAGTCVGEEPVGSDGGPGDGPPIGGDGPMTDGPGAGPCMTSGAYAAIPSVPNGHTYRVLTLAATWQQQRDKCAADSAHLAIPEDTTELAGMLVLGGSQLWVGITDLALENTFVTVLGPPATFLPWANGQPDNKPQPDADCAQADPTDQRLYDEKCGGAYRAVCECVP
jgi:hypothetical protein